jgi:hypothetical protein
MGHPRSEREQLVTGITGARAKPPGRAQTPRVNWTGILAFLITADGVTRALAWGSAAQQAGDVDRRLERCDPDGSEAVLAIWGDYSVATATAPPIPTPVYRKHKEQLEHGWAGRHIGQMDTLSVHYSMGGGGIRHAWTPGSPC